MTGSSLGGEVRSFLCTVSLRTLLPGIIEIDGVVGEADDVEVSSSIFDRRCHSRTRDDDVSR